MTKRALISVYDKTRIAEFASFLIETGHSLLATGGSFATVSEAGVAVTGVSEYTGADEILDGRVKTLHPKIHGGLLGRRDNSLHVAVMENRGIDPIDVLVVNLYPFFEKSAEGMPLDELLEFVDIGGVAMLRAAAKNHSHVLVLSDPSDYDSVIAEWRAGASFSQETRRRLAAKAFALTAAYDAAVATALLGDRSAPDRITLSHHKVMDLRYGENPHQAAAWYIPSSRVALGALSDLNQHQGKALSFNNLRDMDAAWRAVNEFEKTACVGVKHAAPCGAALGNSSLIAWERARDADPVSIFGGIAAFNRPVDEETAQSLSKVFLEVVAAPGYTPGAIEVLRRKKNLRVISLNRPPRDRWEVLPVDGGLCFQESDRGSVSDADWTVPTGIQPSAEQLVDLMFAWKVVKQVKSNAIVVASDGATVGIGGGQPNRVGAIKIALEGRAAQGAVLASDAFFPFDDSVKLAADAGIAAIIQPGGSVRDADSVQACDDAGIAMVFTGRRHLRH